MRQVRIIVEYRDDGASEPVMRWERSAATDGCGTFELLGRAFEVAHREDGAAFGEGLAAFFKGAMIRKGDVEGMVGWME